MPTKKELIEMLGEFRSLTRMIQSANIVIHDDIDRSEWDSRMNYLERRTGKIIEDENARSSRGSPAKSRAQKRV
ncbi:MAG: hypothetical protein ACYSR5_05120 [Planctomycetota bacterium]